MATKEEILKELGLSDKEITTYLAVLKLGQSTANTIADKSNLNRVTCYDILKSLKEKGLVSYVIKSGVKYFESAEPQKLLGDLQEKEQKLKSILPELESLKQSLKEKPSIELYEGIPGLKTVIEDVLKENKESWFISDPIFIDSLEFYFPHFLKKKRKAGMYSKIIGFDSPRSRERQRLSPKKYADFRFTNIKFPTTKIIYGNKVATLAFEKGNEIGIITKNKEIAETEKRIFDLLWKSAKK